MKKGELIAEFARRTGMTGGAPRKAAVHPRKK